MADLSVEDKCELAARLIEQTPPGEINDVINDIRTIINDDQALMPHVLPALRSYNLSQLHVIEHPELDEVPAHTSLLSKAVMLPGSENERYVDNVGKKSFAFDHLTFTVSDYRPYELPEEEETFRAELARSLEAYSKNHFPSGFYSVACSQFPLNPQPTATDIAEPESMAPDEAAPAEDLIPTAAEGEPSAETAVEKMDVEDDVDVTDVVDELVNSGDLEPSSTPAVGHVDSKGDISDPERLEALDEAVEEEKEREEEEERENGEGNVVEKISEPKAEEEDGPKLPEEEEEEIEKKIEGLNVEEKKQERIENPLYTLEVVGNRYNPSNFWTGRWRTRWVVDQAAGKVNGIINVNVHYYEQGNVQLATNHTASFPCPTEPNGSQSIASQIVTTISKIETNYQLELNDVYNELGEKAFRALRRTLPVTRQKVDWDKVTGYTLGADLSKART
ncbi:hypothetical protein CNBB1210 [Cryptococcus deneoformans B-3501A]|uniref:hypothetical protein n=1 Tax=Cryptococcus deneoformans (strain B-3501A) TaxID=283643 RepID=UPI000042FEF8|nr:hypothetical protein CNBB1210 [Cryptococcus neoformans var. neoformans B-3501A]EAL22672.1 hypothetical protein CNBB1210 [Cryptococcus neoformans var. neoformans B-3501A]